MELFVQPMVAVTHKAAVVVVLVELHCLVKNAVKPMAKRFLQALTSLLVQMGTHQLITTMAFFNALLPVYMVAVCKKVAIVVVYLAMAIFNVKAGSTKFRQI